MKKIFFFLFIASGFQYTNCHAQAIPWENIESAINKKNSTGVLQQQLEAIKLTAIANADDIAIARSFYLLLKIADLKTEDSLFFITSAFEDSMLHNKKSSPMLLSLMHILKAKRIENFKDKFYSSNKKKLFLLPANAADYRLLNSESLDSIVYEEYYAAESISKTLKYTDAQDLLWLCSNPLIFLFKPDYTDIIFAEEIKALPAENISYTPDLRWLEQPAATFFSDTAFFKNSRTFLPVYNIFKRWALYHENEKEKFYFIEVLIRKYFYDNIFPLENQVTLYKKYLDSLALSPYNTVKATGIYQLINYYIKNGKKYTTDGYDPASQFYYASSTDTTYRYDYTKALELFETNSSLLDSFLYLKNTLQAKLKNVLEGAISLRSESIACTAKNISLKIGFKNTAYVFLQIKKINNGYFLDTAISRQAGTAAVRQLPVFRNIIIPLPQTTDHQSHSATYIIDSLPAGHYAVVFSNKADDNSDLHYIFLTVSNIAAINNDRRFFVLDRSTGQPLNNAIVLVKYKKANTDKTLLSAAKKVNSAGWINIKEDGIKEVIIINGNDTVSASYKKADDNLDEKIFDKETDDLQDFYADNITARLYTDRSIYRPGQKVFFKGILFIRDPITGKQVLLNRKNLKFPLSQKLFNKDVKDLKKELLKNKINLYIEDAFGRNTDTIEVSLNDYGSFSGSYTLSKKAATGDWEFDMDYEIDSRQSGDFSVEEYKRPAFELTIEKPSSVILLGDSFDIKIRTRSFAGAQLSNTLINFSVDADISLPLKSRPDTMIYRTVSLSDTAATPAQMVYLLLKLLRIRYLALFLKEMIN